jgi:hypothetical protein
MMLRRAVVRKRAAQSTSKHEFQISDLKLSQISNLRSQRPKSKIQSTKAKDQNPKTKDQRPLIHHIA